MPAEPATEESSSRSGEWFVPRIGPLRFRILVGLLFLPYTGMVLAFAVLGSIAAAPSFIHWDRVLAIAIIYFFGLGIAAHALDALGSKRQKPWGTVYTKPQLKLMAAVSLVIAYAIAIFYMIYHVPFLWTVAVLDG